MAVRTSACSGSAYSTPRDTINFTKGEAEPGYESAVGYRTRRLSRGRQNAPRSGRRLRLSPEGAMIVNIRAKARGLIAVAILALAIASVPHGTAYAMPKRTGNNGTVCSYYNPGNGEIQYY